MNQRRPLAFASFDEAMNEAQRSASGSSSTSGNYSSGQILEHLARTLDVVTGDLTVPAVAFPIRWLARAVRPLFLKRSMRPGFKLPVKTQSVLWPSEPVEVGDAWSHLQESARRFRHCDRLPPHPIFGRMNRREHEALQCRHFELHLSFLHPSRQS